MKYRKLGNAEILISEIGFGAWGIGGVSAGATSYGPTDDDSSRRALKCALDRGINFYDTSNVYGEGHSETLIGEALLKKRDRVVVATKVGLVEYGKPIDFSIKSLTASLEASLKRLQTDYVDLMQLHNPSPNAIEQDNDILDWVCQLKKEGKIRSFGVSARSPEDGFWAIERLKAECVQVNFNLLDRRAIDSGLMKSAEVNKVSLIARTPLCFGFLTGKLNEETCFDERDHRSNWPSQQIEKWIQGSRKILSCKTESPCQTDTQFALRFCLSYPQIMSVIPGILTEREVEENIIASDLGALPESELRMVEKVYQEIQNLIEENGLQKARPRDPGKIDRL
jgi:aryl-alcohol dehydrogenase-like predicted oxidoreductase